MKMSVEEMVKKVEAIKELEAFLKEVTAEIDGYKNELKEVMNAENVTTMNVGRYVVRNTPVSTMRFDTKKFKDDFGSDIYAEYCKEVESVRFSIN